MHNGFWPRHLRGTPRNAVANSASSGKETSQDQVASDSQPQPVLDYQIPATTSGSPTSVSDEAVSDFAEVAERDQISSLPISGSATSWVAHRTIWGRELGCSQNNVGPPAGTPYRPAATSGLPVDGYASFTPVRQFCSNGVRTSLMLPKLHTRTLHERHTDRGCCGYLYQKAFDRYFSFCL